MREGGLKILMTLASFHKYFGFCAASQIFAGLHNGIRLVSKCSNDFSIVIAQKRAERKGAK